MRTFSYRLVEATPPPVPRYDIGGFHVCPGSLPEREPFHFDHLDPNHLLISLIHAVEPRPDDLPLLKATPRAVEIWSVDGKPLSSVMSLVNRRVCMSGAPRRPIHLLVARLDLKAHQFHCASAGGQFVLLVRKGEVARHLGVAGPALGAAPESYYEDHSERLKPDDVLLIYNHAMGRAGNRWGERFGADRLVELVREHPGADSVQLVHSAAESLFAFLGLPEAVEEMALLVLRRPGEGA